ncbi:MAG: zf-TFIIB domain-containing protein [Cyanobacteria bacterium P01_D01_bin.73]
MLCPKDCETELEERTTDDDLAVHHCRGCKGEWIQAESYRQWQEEHGDALPNVRVLGPVLDPDFEASLEDVQASLCPECKHYLSRSRIGFGQSFFLERCKNCGGFWCDRGEWDLLAKLEFHTNLDYLFTPDWQDAARQREQQLTERRVLIEKVGEELAHQVFEMAEKLEGSPNGDFAVAYLMRRFDGDS